MANVTATGRGAEALAEFSASAQDLMIEDLEATARRITVSDTNSSFVLVTSVPVFNK